MSTTPTNTSDGPGIQHTRWRIDPERSSVELHVRHLWGLQTVKGRFERYAELSASAALIALTAPLSARPNALADLIERRLAPEGAMLASAGAR